jgi:hypothetical protein
MTSLPQTQQRGLTAQSRRRSSPAPDSQAAASDARSRSRQALPAIDASQEFGCVDWFLYPDASAAEAKLERARA